MSSKNMIAIFRWILLKVIIFAKAIRGNARLPYNKKAKV